MEELSKGSVLLTDGPSGTAWQRHHKDGLWHSTAGRTAEWKNLEDRQFEVLYEAPAREHDNHEIRYTEEKIIRTFKARITFDGDVVIDPDEVEIDFMTDTSTGVWCVTCQRPLTPENSPLSDDWQVL